MKTKAIGLFLVWAVILVLCIAEGANMTVLWLAVSGTVAAVFMLFASQETKGKFKAWLES